jgi:uncharacterized membrane protein YphA (DoxX/SURF4 family)
VEALRLDPILAWILRAALATLFAAAALHKIRTPADFLETFSDYEILPALLTIPSVVLLVAAEALVALGLLIEPIRIYAALGGVALLVLYSLAIGVNLLRGRHEIDCGCLGPAKDQPLSYALILRNGSLAAAALVASLPVSGRVLHPVDAITLFGGLVVVFLLFNAINMLAAIASPRPGQESLS